VDYSYDNYITNTKPTKAKNRSTQDIGQLAVLTHMLLMHIRLEVDKFVTICHFWFVGIAV